jgi:hypothetical protein
MFCSGGTKYHCLSSLCNRYKSSFYFFSVGFQGTWHGSPIFKKFNLKNKTIPYSRNKLKGANVTLFQRWIFNATFSSYRVYVEHVTDEIKLYEVLSIVYRHELLNKKLCELTSLCCAALANKRCRDFHVTSPTSNKFENNFLSNIFLKNPCVSDSLRVTCDTPRVISWHYV